MGRYLDEWILEEYVPTISELLEANAQLRGELDRVHRELAALHDGSARLRVAYIVVGDEQPIDAGRRSSGRRVEIRPGELYVSDDTNGCHVHLSTHDDQAEVGVVAGDTLPPRGVQRVAVGATLDWDFEEGGPRAWVDVTSDDPHIELCRLNEEGFASGDGLDLAPEMAQPAS